MIAKITDAYVRRYSDSGQVTAYVEWVDGRGRTGRTEGHVGPCRCCGGAMDVVDGHEVGAHMAALFNRAKREGVTIRQEAW